jgi:choline/carnitine o-acyltransferase/KR domain-containing protein/phosphopantetheine binding protein
MKAEQFHQVLLPKVHGTQYLVKYCPPSCLDFFIMLSSVVGVAGGPGQANYSAASVFQDNYARYLTSIGEPTITLDLGWMKGAGYIEEHQLSVHYVANKGMQPVTMDTFFRALSYAFSRKPQNPEQSQITLGLSSGMSEHLMKIGRFSHVWVRRAQTSKGGPVTTASAAQHQKALLGFKTYQEANAYVCEKLLEKIALLTSVPAANVKLDDGLADSGIDSLIGIELRNFIRQDLGTNLGTFEILGVNSIKDLGDLVTQKCRWLAEADFKDAPTEKPAEAQRGEPQKAEPKKEEPNGIRVDVQSTSDTPSETSGDSASSPSSSLSSVSAVNDKLPILPVPSLDITISSLDKSLRLILSEKAYLKSKGQIDQFVAADGPGHKLQARLVEHAKTRRNWHSDVWIDKQYFESRLPVAPFTNYFGVQKPSDSLPPGLVAACICAALLEFQQEVESGTLERDLLRDAAAEMEQYKNMFNACRIPQKPKDRIVRFNAASHRHIVIIRDGHFIKLNYEYQGRRLGLAQLIRVLDSILEMELGTPSEIGAFTTLDRDTWADVS